ncbi:hypothetical protein PanWU01x14_019500, partial [Parasponia andersonii]
SPPKPHLCHCSPEAPLATIPPDVLPRILVQPLTKPCLVPPSHLAREKAARIYRHRTVFHPPFRRLMSDHHTTTTVRLVSTPAFIFDHSRPPARVW